MANRKRRIFISDIHMGIAEGQSGPHPYGWLHNDRALLLQEFLDSLQGANAVDELVVVGDLFDEWVMPFSVVTPADGDAGWFDKVAATQANTDILTALSELTERTTVTYVHGNHDMQLTREILHRLAPGVRWVGDNPGMGVYSQDGIHAEHGSLYCLFNAPYLLWGNTDQQIPLGFFVARADAQYTSDGHTLHWGDYLKLFFDIAQEILEKKELAQAFIDGLVRVMKIDPDVPVYLYGIDGFVQQSTTINAMAKRLGDVYAQWDNEWKTQGIPNVSRCIALLGDTGHLYPAASHNFTPSTNLVIYGHTHKWELAGVTTADLPDFTREINEVDLENMDLHTIEALSNRYDPGADTFEGHIYANCGTWINGSDKNPLPATYVEVLDEDGTRQVTVYQYEKGAISRPLQTRSIQY